MDLTVLLRSRLIRSLLIVLISLVIQLVGVRLIRFFIHRAIKQSKSESASDVKKQQDTLIAVFSTTFTAILWITIFCIVLGVFGVNVAALLTGAGFVGVLFGLSAQNSIKDLLAGMYLLFEKQYRVGDTVSFSGGGVGMPGISGRVEQITLRITKLRDLNGNLVTVRNGDPSIIKNETYTYASVVLDFTITYDSNIVAFERAVDEVGTTLAKNKKWAEHTKSPIKFLRVDDFTPAGVVVRAIGKVSPASQWDIAGEYRRRLLVAVNKLKDVDFAHS